MTIDWGKQFLVVSLSRNDLALADLTDEEIAPLTDADMEVIAKLCKDDLHPDYEQLQFIAKLYLVERDMHGRTKEV